MIVLHVVELSSSFRTSASVDMHIHILIQIQIPIPVPVPVPVPVPIPIPIPIPIHTYVCMYVCMYVDPHKEVLVWVLYKTVLTCKVVSPRKIRDGSAKGKQ